MKYYFVEHYYDKGAPFGVSSRVKLYSGNDLIAIHEHIHYDQIKDIVNVLKILGTRKYVIMMAMALNG